MARQVCAIPVFLLALALAGCEGCEPADYVKVSSEDLPVCSDSYYAEASDALSNSLDVAVLSEVDEAYVGFTAAEKQWPLDVLFGGNWYPIDGFRHTVCGEFHSFGVFDGLGAEIDWNIFVVPSAEYEYISRGVAEEYCPTADQIQEALEESLSHEYAAGDVLSQCDDWHSCGDQLCVELETTTHEAFFDNPWFHVELVDWECLLDSGLTEACFVVVPPPHLGDGICAYGPWVSEKLHDMRPEIHPAELLWWKYGGYTYLLLVQDNSKRFDSFDDYDNSWTSMDSEPWATPPVGGAFRFPIRLMTDRPAASVTIFEDAARLVVPNSEDADEGLLHGLEVDGKVLMRVHEAMADENVQVWFDDLCRNEYADQVFGWLRLESAVGQEGEDGGFQLLRVTGLSQPSEDDVGLPPQGEEPPPRKVFPFSLVYEPHSVRQSQVDGRPVQTIDIVLKPRPGLRHEGVIATTWLDSLVQKRELTRFADIASGEIRVAAVPLIEGSTLAVQHEDSAWTAVELPGVGLDVVSAVRARSLVESNGMAWLTFAGAAGLSPERRMGGFRLASEWNISAYPIYGLISSGYNHTEDKTQIGIDLQESLKPGEESRARDYFGSAMPVELNWTFEAKDLATGTELPVVVQYGTLRPQRSHQVTVALTGQPEGSSVAIAFQPRRPNSVFQLEARLRATDVLGGTVDQLLVAESHVIELSDDNRGAIFGEILSGNDPTSQSRGEFRRSGKGEQDRTFRRQLIEVSAADGILTLTEIGRLIGSQ